MSQTLSGTDTDFAYDAWGRMTSKTQGDYSATYAYRYGSKLYTVASNFPGEGTVTWADGSRLLSSGLKTKGLRPATRSGGPVVIGLL